MKVLEERGYRVVGAHEVAPELVAEPGHIAGPPASAATLADAAVGDGRRAGHRRPRHRSGGGRGRRRGWSRSRPRKAPTPCSSASRSCAPTAGSNGPGAAGVLAKRAKPQQDLRVDMPAIGPRTVEARGARRPCGHRHRGRAGDDRRTGGNGGAGRAHGHVHLCRRRPARHGRTLMAGCVADSSFRHRRRGIGRPARRQSDARAQRAARRQGPFPRRRRRAHGGAWPPFDVSDGGGRRSTVCPRRSFTRRGCCRASGRPRDAVVAADPDVLVLIDCPGFNLRVGKIIGRRRPDIPIVDYVSPSVWAYLPRPRPQDGALCRPAARDTAVRAGGASAASAVRRRTYVGHPLIERLGVAAPGAGRTAAARSRRAAGASGASRAAGAAKCRRLMERVRRDGRAASPACIGPIEVVLPAVPHLAEEIRAARRRLAGAARRSSRARRRTTPPSDGPMRRSRPPAR